MKWRLAKDEEAMWQLTRWEKMGQLGQPQNGLSISYFFEQEVAMVRRSAYSPLFIGQEYFKPKYQAEVVTKEDYGRARRPAPDLFPSLKAAQLWCEQEVRLMEVVELA